MLSAEFFTQHAKYLMAFVAVPCGTSFFFYIRPVQCLIVVFGRSCLAMQPPSWRRRWLLCFHWFVTSILTVLVCLFFHLVSFRLAPVSSDKIFIHINLFDNPLKYNQNNIMTIKAGHWWSAFIVMILFWFYFSRLLSNMIIRINIHYWRLEPV